MFGGGVRLRCDQWLMGGLLVGGVWEVWMASKLRAVVVSVNGHGSDRALSVLIRWDINKLRGMMN